MIGRASSLPVAQRIDFASGTDAPATPVVSMGVTPNEGEFLIIIASCVQPRDIAMSTPGFTTLYTVNGIDGSFGIFYKFCGAGESNAYTLNYSVASTNWSWYAATFTNVNPSGPASIVGANNNTGGTNFSLNASTVGANMVGNDVLIAAIITDSTVSGFSFSNSFINKRPASGSSYFSNANRVYSSPTSGQNTSITVTGTCGCNTVLIKINPLIT